MVSPPKKNPTTRKGGGSFFFKIFLLHLFHAHCHCVMKLRIVNQSSSKAGKERNESILPETQWDLSHLHFNEMKMKTIDKLIRKFQMANSTPIRDKSPAVSSNPAVELKKKKVQIPSYSRFLI